MLPFMLTLLRISPAIDDELKKALDDAVNGFHGGRRGNGS
jgi:hypothetical protein